MLKPSDVCIVPEKKQELTTEGGLNVAGQIKTLKETVDKSQEAGIRVSLFIDPEENQVSAAKEVGAIVLSFIPDRYASVLKRRRKGAELKKLSLPLTCV